MNNLHYIFLAIITIILIHFFVKTQKETFNSNTTFPIPIISGNQCDTSYNVVTNPLNSDNVTIQLNINNYEQCNIHDIKITLGNSINTLCETFKATINGTEINTNVYRYYEDKIETTKPQATTSEPAENTQAATSEQVGTVVVLNVTELEWMKDNTIILEKTQVK